MKLNTIIKTTTAALLFASAGVQADADGVLPADAHAYIDHNTSVASSTSDPIAEAFPDNPELFAGHTSDGNSNVSGNRSSLDELVAGSSESEIIS